VDTALLAEGPSLGAHFMLLLPAIALDLWYATRTEAGGTAHDWVTGSVLYAMVFLLVGLPYAQVVVGVPGLDALAVVQSVAIGLLAAAAAGWASRDIGNWAAELGRTHAG